MIPIQFPISIRPFIPCCKILTSYSEPFIHSKDPAGRCSSQLRGRGMTRRGLKPTNSVASESFAAKARRFKGSGLNDNRSGFRVTSLRAKPFGSPTYCNSLVSEFRIYVLLKGEC